MKIIYKNTFFIICLIIYLPNLSKLVSFLLTCPHQHQTPLLEVQPGEEDRLLIRDLINKLI